MQVNRLYLKQHNKAKLNNGSAIGSAVGDNKLGSSPRGENNR